VVPVTRDDSGRLAIGGVGRPIDWLVEMVRFDQNDLFDQLASRGALDPALMLPLAATIAEMHEAAERRPDRGGSAGIAWVIEGNAAGFVSEPGLAADSALGGRITVACRAMNDSLRVALDARRESGFVRRCHGDLHLGNIVQFQGRPTLFDAVEFNDAIACIDVLYDLAFVLMDLGRQSLWRDANVLLNAYLSDTLDFDGLAALPLFLGCRAAVRAKTVATAAALQTDAAQQGHLTAEARHYLALAGQLLEAPRPCLVAIGGLSGSGKSALAAALAPEVGAAPGAIIVRSDELRKRLFGVAPLTRLGPESYTPNVSTRVYTLMAARVRAIVASGHTAIVDATFLGSASRRTFEDIARDVGLPFAGVWLEAPEGDRLDRVRRRSHDPSDADTAVILGQTVEGQLAWTRIDASRPPDVVLDDVRGVISDTGALRRD
jgi:aminoglycoside phosphotransferase family enzyme